MGMNIFKNLPGNKVRFTGTGGYDGDLKWAKKELEVGKVYTIDRIEIYQSSSNVFLKERPGKGFNSVQFTDVDLIDYKKILELTNQDFTDFIYNQINEILKIRVLESFRISIDDFGCEPSDDPNDEPDKPTIVFDLMTRGALWTFWFDTDEGKYNYDILGEDRVNRYITIKSGKVPEFPGVYTNEDKNPV